jgi:hypothetical protein
MKNTILVLVMAMVLMASAVSAIVAVPVPDPHTTCQSAGSMIGIYGYVLDENGNGYDGAPINVTCEHITTNGSIFYDLPTGGLVSNGAYDGFYYVRHDNSGAAQCWEGDKVQVIVTLDDVTHTSNWTNVVCESYYYNTANGGSISVPEFTTITMGVAIAGAMLGLVFLRKNN